MDKINISLQPNEEIKPIIGYEGLYSITSFGRVWSHEKIRSFGVGYRICGGIFLNFKIDKDDYFRLDLRNKGFKKSLHIHRLVAQAFIPNPNNLPEVNHKDGDKQNNHKDNLEWCTHSDNLKHAMVNRLIKKETSRFHGVFFKFDKKRKKWWVSQIQHNKKRKEIGRFLTEIEAAKVYNDFILKNKLNRPLNEV